MRFTVKINNPSYSTQASRSTDFTHLSPIRGSYTKNVVLLPFRMMLKSTCRCVPMHAHKSRSLFCASANKHGFDTDTTTNKVVRAFSLTTRDIRGTIQILRRDCWYLSPTNGLALDAHANSNISDGLLGSIHSLGMGRRDITHCPPLAFLARELLHKNFEDESLRCTKNMSLPAFYLSECKLHVTFRQLWLADRYTPFVSFRWQPTTHCAHCWPERYRRKVITNVLSTTTIAKFSSWFQVPRK